jgi:hypothetical protein
MARPHDIWEFGWNRPYDERHAYIQSLPENEQEWATLTFHYIDYAFRVEVENRTRNISWNNGGDVDKYSDRVEQIRNQVKDRLEPPTDDRWKTRFQPGWHDKFYGEENDE